MFFSHQERNSEPWEFVSIFCCYILRGCDNKLAVCFFGVTLQGKLNQLGATKPTSKMNLACVGLKGKPTTKKVIQKL